jgi:AraC family transcriptional regulator
MELEPPRIENKTSFSIAGLTERYNMQEVSGIPAQWQRFTRYIGKIPGQIGSTSYGACFNFDAGAFDYMCAVEVSAEATIAEPLTRLRIPEHRYAVFSHRDHILKIGSTWGAIFNQWLPASGHKAANAPQLEQYGEDFDPGTGLVEIWIPIE